jgi:hypothetical protein
MDILAWTGVQNITVIESPIFSTFREEISKDQG